MLDRTLIEEDTTLTMSPQERTRISDLMRDGCSRFDQASGWGDGVNSGCALTTLFVEARERGLL